MHHQKSASASFSASRKLTLHNPTTSRMPSLAEISEMAKAPIKAAADALWNDADANQQKLTTQLARNSFYFTLSAFVIRLFGDYLAI